MKAANWFIDEIPFAGQEHLDKQYVETYDDKAATNPDEDLSVLREYGLNNNHTLIDFGAGTGTFALAAATLCKHVIATDISSAMVDSFNKKISQAGINNITCVQSSFLTYQHQDDLADFVYTRHALHHLPDFWKAIALQRMANILKSGGILYLRDLVYSCELDEIETVLETWFGNAPINSDDGWTKAEL